MHELMSIRCARGSMIVLSVTSLNCLMCCPPFPAQASVETVWIPVLLRWANYRLEQHGSSIPETPRGTAGLPADTLYKLVEVSCLPSSSRHPLILSSSKSHLDS